MAIDNPGNSDNRFEPLRHKTHTGEEHTIPLLLDGDSGVNEDSNALLHAADIVFENMALDPMLLQSLVDRIGGLLTEQAGTAFVIEGKEGSGSIAVDQELSRVIIPGIGNFVTPTEKMFAMLYQLQEYSEQQGSS